MSKKGKRRAIRRQRRMAVYGALALVCVACMMFLAKRGAPVDVAEAAIIYEATPTPTPICSTPIPTPIPTPEPTPILSAVPEITAAPTPVTITITAAGDCTLGGSVHQSTYVQFKRAVQTYGYDYFFSNTRPIFEADDLTIVNLEGPLTDVGSGRKGSYVFKGDPDYVNILTGSSVELCNVANNHSQDFGKEGLERTAEILEAAGVGCCGYTKVFRTEIRGVKISALGYLEWEIDKQKIVDAVKAERPNCDLLIVNMHWGREKHFEPVKAQKTYGYAIIDAGADLIIGTHPHVYGGVEKYKGKYIVYSLGNFCFGGNANPTDKRALLFRQAFTVSPEGEVSDGGVDIIPVSVSSVPKKNDYRPTVMSFADGVKLLQAMSKYSNFSEGFVWLPGSYPEQAGLLKSGVMS